MDAGLGARMEWRCDGCSTSGFGRIRSQRCMSPHVQRPRLTTALWGGCCPAFRLQSQELGPGIRTVCDDVG